MVAAIHPSRTRRWLQYLVAAAALALLAACGDDDAGDTTVVSSLVTEEPALSSSTTDVPKSTTSDGVSTTVAAACTEDALFQVVNRDLPRTPEVILVGVEISECQAGYARVIALPDQSICPEGNNCMENEPVFLRDVAGRWEIIGSGTGLTCADADLSEDLVAACEALDLP